jgi:hypothetical protein
MNPYLCHLSVKLDDYWMLKVWGRKSAVPCHIVDGVKMFDNLVLTKLVIHNSVVFIDQPLLGHEKVMADRALHLVPKLAKKRSGRNVN